MFIIVDLASNCFGADKDTGLSLLFFEIAADMFGIKLIKVCFSFGDFLTNDKQRKRQSKETKKFKIIFMMQKKKEEGKTRNM